MTSSTSWWRNSRRVHRARKRRILCRRNGRRDRQKIDRKQGVFGRHGGVSAAFRAAVASHAVSSESPRGLRFFGATPVYAFRRRFIGSWSVGVSLGDQSRVLLGDDYERIRKELLPGKESAQLRNRSKNQRNGKSNRMNVHRRYFALYSEFRKWDDSVYKKICQLIMTHRRHFTGVRGSDELASAAAIVLLLLQRDVAALLLAEPVLLRGEVASRGHAAVPHHACEHGEQGGDGDAG